MTWTRFKLGAGCALGLAAALTALAFALASSADAAFPGRNGKIVYSKVVSYPSGTSGTSEVITRDPDGRNPTTLLRCSNDPAAGCKDALSDPAYSRTGAMLALECLGAGRALCTMRSDGTGLRAVPPLTRFEEDPAWSPRGRLAFTGFGPTEILSDIYAAGADGSGLRRLTPSAKEDRQPTWSIRNRIAFNRAGFKGVDVYTMRGDGRRVRRLTFHGGAQPAWSPHGTKLAFVRDDDIYTMRANGRGLRRLTRGRGELTYESPAWSPDGKRIAFLVHRLSGSWWSATAIYTVRTDGRKRRLIDRVPQVPGSMAPVLSGLSGPDWQPLPRRGRD